MIKDIRGINDKTVEGKMLLAALAKITTESQIDKTPDEVLNQIADLCEQMYEPEWKKYMDLAVEVAGISSDTSRRIGCVIVKNNVTASGCNDFPWGVKDIPERREPPLKYKFTRHAEINALANFVAAGNDPNGATVYVIWFPCSTCALALAEFGIRKLVCMEPDWEEERYDFKTSRTILEEAGVQLQFVDYKYDTRVKH